MHPHYFSRFLFGLLLILLGSAFLLDQLDIIPNLDFGELFKLYWPVILIVLGLKGLLFSKSLRYGWVGSIFWNFVIILVGGYFLTRNLGWIDIDIRQLWKFALPAFLILIGVSILFRSPHRHPRHWADGHDWSAGAGSHGSDGAIGEENIGHGNIGNGHAHGGYGSAYRHAERRRRAQERRAERHYGSSQQGNSQRTDRSGFVGDIFLGGDHWDLKPTNVSHFIGDTTIDLTKAAIPHGVTPIQISAFIGDVKIYVPNDADVAVSVTSSVFMGDQQVLNRYENGMFKSMKEESPGYELADKKVKLNISMFIGDIVVIQVG
jgi:lia operon protein LiaF